MLRDVLTKGPLWYSDYGLYGMQYGATQFFEEAIPAYLRQNPNARIMMTSTWANGADTFIRFFLPKDQQSRVQMLNVDYFMKDRRPLDATMLLVMTPTEYEQAKTSGKFKSVDVDRVLPYPDGQPGFYFARLVYADNLEQIVQQEKATRSQPVVETISMDGQSVEVSHSIFDAGQLKDLFDGDTVYPGTRAGGQPAGVGVRLLPAAAARGVIGSLWQHGLHADSPAHGQRRGEPKCTPRRSGACRPIQRRNWLSIRGRRWSRRYGWKFSSSTPGMRYTFTSASSACARKS